MSESDSDSDSYKLEVKSKFHHYNQKSLAKKGEDKLLDFEELSKISSEPPSESFEGDDQTSIYDARETYVRTKSTINDYIIELICPGLNLGDVHIELGHYGILHIEGECKPSHEYETGKLLQSERKFGKFGRNIRLPKDASQMIQANLSVNGIIYITIQRLQLGDVIF